MAQTNRTAFTLVEILVVIVIISMLVALLVPAVISARERARQASCVNRMSELGKAIIEYETSKEQLPGYVNELGGGSLGGKGIASVANLSWAVVILANIERGDLWEEWRMKTGSRPVVAEPKFVCPSDSAKQNVDGALSFVVNCGISDYKLEDGTSDANEYRTKITWPTNYDPYAQRDWGLFFCNDSNISKKPSVHIGVDEIQDGATQTLLLSENLDATNWAFGSDPTQSPPSSDPTIRQSNLGFVWWSANPALPWAGDIPDNVMINAESSTNPRYKARPSSNHRGGVNAVFADSHHEFISDRVDYDVFRDQMISNQTEAKKHGLIP